MLGAKRGPSTKGDTAEKKAVAVTVAAAISKAVHKLRI